MILNYIHSDLVHPGTEGEVDFDAKARVFFIFVEDLGFIGSYQAFSSVGNLLSQTDIIPSILCDFRLFEGPECETAPGYYHSGHTVCTAQIHHLFWIF